jgi:hypothetical protein
LRRRDRAEHWPVISPELWLKLMDELCWHSRYNFELHMSRRELCNITTSAARSDPALSKRHS